MKTHVDSFLFVSYPVVYLILVTPISCARWLSGFGRSPKVNIPSAATLATEFLFTLSGLANVFIFIFTRKNLFILENTNHVLPPTEVFESNNMRMTMSQSQPQAIFPGMDNGGWALPSVRGTPESEEAPYSDANSAEG